MISIATIQNLIAMQVNAGRLVASDVDTYTNDSGSMFYSCDMFVLGYISPEDREILNQLRELFFVLPVALGGASAITIYQSLKESPSRFFYIKVEGNETVIKTPVDSITGSTLTFHLYPPKQEGPT